MTLFATEFLENYLRFGLGSMPKSDIDALVMHLIDLHGFDETGPTGCISNQAVSEKLKTPVSKVKKLRYDAALKFGGSVEVQAKGRLLAALEKASLDVESDKICLIIEDSLAKNWLQDQLKRNRQIFDHSFNTEIVKVTSDGLFDALTGVFDKHELQKFSADYERLKKEISAIKRKQLFANITKKFVEGAARAAGSGVMAVLKTHVGFE